MDIADIIEAIRAGRVRITDHADEEAHYDQLTFDEISSSVLDGEIIEDYPEDQPYPSCLIYGSTFRRDPVHSVWVRRPHRAGYHNPKAIMLSGSHMPMARRTLTTAD